MIGMPTPRTSPSPLSSDTCTGSPTGLGDGDGLGDGLVPGTFPPGSIQLAAVELPARLQPATVEASAAPPSRSRERRVVPWVIRPRYNLNRSGAGFACHRVMCAYSANLGR
ncbi:hypothetical protein Raf01_40640 [Rugosimonospora africana]|uniref:Uncharacterized protein n=1 Tax=Rugosimonospora africana TaxID=556532 RepID=A0A8J3QTV6_9ACTN|nr:hypothetical protein Raf01_40640 [Rugosimonospora africana]